MKYEWKKYIVLFLTAVMLFACAAAEGAQETAAIETQAAIKTESAAADEEKIITLPAQLTIIEEEAFYGSAAIGRVIVPEGVEEIRARAFADSCLTAIELPASLTMIADDAFDGVSGLTATVMDGSYAKTYCEAHGIAYTMPDMPIVIRSVLPEETTVEIDGYGRWTVDAAGSYMPFSYDYVLMRNGEMSSYWSSTSPKAHSYMWKTGTYVLQVTITDAKGNVATASSAPVTVVPRPLKFISVTPDRTSAAIGETIEWSLSIDGGDGEVITCSLTCDGVEIDSMSSRYAYSYDPDREGEYILTVTAVDASGVQLSMVSEPVTVAGMAYAPESDFTYELRSETEAVITGYIGEGSSVVIPETIAGVPVVEIGMEAFTDNWGFGYDGCESLRLLILPFNVKVIGERAFSDCANLRKVDLAAVEKIGGGAFANCTSLTRISFPKSVTHLGSGVLSGCTALTKVGYPVNLAENQGYGVGGYFYGCTSLKTIEVPEGVTCLPEYVFRDAASLESITLPSTLVKVGQLAFSGCTGLKEILLPPSVTYIGSRAFNNCTGLTSFVYPVGLSNAEYAISSIFEGCTNLKKIIIPEGTARVAPGAFSDNAIIEEVELPASLREIGDSAFENSKGLKTVTFKNGLETIGVRAFRGCESLTAVNLPDSVKEIDYEAFHNCTALEKFHYPVSLERVDWIFDNCPNLNVIAIPEGVTKLPRDVFSLHTGLKEVYLPSSLLEIGYGAFSGCTGLEDVHFKEGLLHIDGYAFSGCTSLKEADLPDSVKHIEQSVFSGCTALESFHYPLSWDDTYVGQALTGPEYGAYQVGGCPLIKKIVVPEGVMTIPYFAFTDCEYIEEVVLPSTLVEIQQGAFMNCGSLKKVRIPASVQIIGKDAFKDCGNLTAECEWGTAAYKHLKAHDIPFNYLSLDNENLPKDTLPLGEDFMILGFIRSNQTVTHVSAAVYNADGSEWIQGANKQTDATYIPLLTTVGDAFDFAALEQGRYLFRLTATVGGVTETLAENVFTVSADDTIWAKIYDASSPTGIFSEGEEFSITGTVKFRFATGTVKVVVHDDIKGEDVLSYFLQKEASEFNVADAQSALDFRSLEPGIYTYRVTAYVSAKEYTLEETYFRIATRDEEIERAAKLDAALLSGSGAINSDLRYESVVLSNAAYDVNKLRRNLTALGFEAIEYYSLNSGEHTIGHFFGYKDVLDSEGETTRLYALICRGTRPDSVQEWISDFTFAGPDEYHYGFAVAAEAVREHFSEYVDEHWPEGGSRAKCKVWVTGHSRGAAVANILAGSWLMEDGFARNNVHCYTFACPTVKTGSVSGATNVFNYNLGGDLVPRVPLEDWGFGRYGTTQQLDNGETAFGVQLTDVTTMNQVVDWLAGIEQLDAFQSALIAEMKTEETYTAHKIVMFLVSAGFQVYDDVSDEKDFQLKLNLAEIAKDAGATHSSETYIKWMESLQ